MSSIIDEATSLIYSEVKCHYLSLRECEKEQGDESLYSGTAGMLLFMMRYCLYNKKFNEYELYFSDLKKSLIEGETGEVGFAAGAYGKLIAMMYCDPGNYTINVEEVLSKICSFKRKGELMNEIMNGQAGELLVLLRLYKASKNTEIIDLIVERAINILSSISRYENVLFFDRSKWAYLPLSGYSHGMTGVAYSLLKFSNVFDTGKEFDKIIEQVLMCEVGRYNPEVGDWNDYRISEKDWVDQRKYTPKTFSAWCHGGYGILGVLGKYIKYGNSNNEVLDEFYRINRKKRINFLKCLDYSECNLTFCHGLSGMIECLGLEDGEMGKSIAKRIANEFLSGNRISGIPRRDRPDYSFFNGMSGIGYYLLNQIESLESVLFPDVGLELEPIEIDRELLFRRIADKRYPIMKKITTAPLKAASLLSFEDEKKYLTKHLIELGIENNVALDIANAEIYFIKEHNYMHFHERWNEQSSFEGNSIKLKMNVKYFSFTEERYDIARSYFYDDKVYGVVCVMSENEREYYFVGVLVDAIISSVNSGVSELQNIYEEVGRKLNFDLDEIKIIENQVDALKSFLDYK